MDKPDAPLTDTAGEITADAYMRGLVIIRICGDASPSNPPSQKNLCKLIQDRWREYRLQRYGYLFPCSGSPHVHEAAQVMALFGFMTSRGSIDESVPYELTPLGRILNERLQTKIIHVATASGTIINVDISEWIRVAWEIAHFARCHELLDMDYDELKKNIAQNITRLGW